MLNLSMLRRGHFPSIEAHRKEATLLYNLGAVSYREEATLLYNLGAVSYQNSNHKSSEEIKC